MTCLRRSWAELPSLPRSMPPHPQLALYPPTSLEPLTSNYFKCIFHYHGSAAWLPLFFSSVVNTLCFVAPFRFAPTRFNPLLGPDDVFRANRSSGKAETTFREVITIFRTRRDCSRARTFRFLFPSACRDRPGKTRGPVQQRLVACSPLCWFFGELGLVSFVGRVLEIIFDLLLVHEAKAMLRLKNDDCSGLRVLVYFNSIWRRLLWAGLCLLTKSF